MWKTQRNWEDLANAIILQAVDDYRRSRRRVRKRKDQRDAQQRLREVEKFLGSRWYYQLTNVDGKKLLEYLKKEVVR